jgi:hypothetical protein
MLEIRGTGKLVTWDAESLINGRSSSHQSRDGVKEQHGRRDQNVYKSTSRQRAANGTIRVSIAASNCAPKLSESLVGAGREVNRPFPFGVLVLG